MISEEDLAKLSFSGAPRMITGSIPGPKGSERLRDDAGYESMARGGGGFPLVFDEARGVTVKDPDGNLYIDTSAGVGVNSIGRAHPRVIAAIQEQSERLMHASDISNTRRGELARKVSAIMPPGLRDNCITYFTQSGSGAVESAIKFARKITGRSQIVAFHGAYHGVWYGGNSLTTGEQYRKGYGPFISGVIHAPYAYCYRCPFDLDRASCAIACGKYIDYLLNTPYTAADDVAAVIIEPQQGEGGYVPVPAEFLHAIKHACEKHGALFIADEVQAGAGRTGKMWSIEHSGVWPDMLIWGKGMGGDLPMAGVTLRADLAAKLEPGSQPGTFAGNALSAAVCMTNIDVITDSGFQLVERSARLGEEVLNELNKAAASIPVIGDVRGRGLMIGIELVSDKASKTPLPGNAVIDIVMALLSRGVIMVPCGRNGNVLRLMPSLTIPRTYMFKAVEILLDVLQGAVPAR